jgi:orotate phosphoribosyltransferase
MQDYQREFLDLARKIGALRFGEFILKSGRVSPYFFNSGLFNTGASLARLGRYYAAAITNEGIAYDMLFGPAYKGIPLVAAVSIALAEQHGRDVPYAFNRKEAKTHGEGGITVGAPLTGRVLIVDDVITAGTSVRESVEIITATGAKAVAVAIALDRQERGKGELSAIQEVEALYRLKVVNIVNLDVIIDYLAHQSDCQEALGKIHAYRKQYGT